MKIVPVQQHVPRTFPKGRNIQQRKKTKKKSRNFNRYIYKKMTSDELSPDPQRIWAMSSIDPRVLDGERRSTARLNFTKTREEEETGNVKRRRCRVLRL